MCGKPASRLTKVEDATGPEAGDKMFDPHGADLGEAVSAWRPPGRDAILQPPKPKVENALVQPRPSLRFASSGGFTRCDVHATDIGAIGQRTSCREPRPSRLPNGQASAAGVGARA
jgi:hypothetical protein